MPKFKITSGPTNCNGSSTSSFEIGDVVEIEEGRTPDSDGDFYIVAVGDYIAERDLTPIDGLKDEGVVQISAVRAALVALGIEADVVAVAQAIEKAVSE